ncbi:glycosyltransferase [Mucisphaera sp.]|uniref:glycosyltransferase n=1 Tax=Mucisphaera sp. TaxID=2913024 RepID=UPI003D0A6993
MPSDLPAGSSGSDATTRSRRAEPLLLECAWEVCNQVGGIYTVLRSKVPSMVSRWSNRYCLIGPYLPDKAQVEFEPRPLIGAFGQAVKALNEAGIEAHFGRWLVTGRPNVILVNHLSVFRYLYDVKARIWRDHNIPTPNDDEEINNVVAFGEAVRVLLTLLAEQEAGKRPLIAHFHEWLAGLAIPMLRQENWPGATVFTTHATRLGRVLAMQHPEFYGHLSMLDGDAEAKHYNLEAQHKIESAAAHGSHVFTTVSDITGDECTHLLKRSPDVLLPNGLNIQRFAALHEFQNLHAQYKEEIHEFTIGHFFPSYRMDLDTTLYFFTSGRYEYKNKGMDVTIEALARLNHRLKASGSPVNVVFFIITKAPVRSINVQTLETRSMLSEFHDVANAIKEQVGKGVMLAAAEGRVPDLNELVDEYWRLRLKRSLHAWRRGSLPPIVTHDLLDDQNDDVLNQLRACHLFNGPHDPVKVIYHPAFITTSNPLFGMEYEQFVRGCHLGVFPSYYEPWGYTPLESIALGVPALTSDLSGFGSYLLQLMADHESKGVSIVERRYRDFHATADQIAEQMFRMCQLSRRERITLRNKVESFSEHFDWHNLGRRYHEAHALALDRIG